MAKVKGVDVLIKIGEVTVGGQRGATLNIAADLTDTSTKDSNLWKENEASFKEWSLEFDGLWVVDDAGLAAIRDAILNGTAVDAVMAMPGGDIYGGTALVTEFPIEAPYDDNVTYSGSLTGTGALAYVPAA